MGQISGYIGPFADLPQDSVLVVGKLCSEHSPSHTHSGPAEAATDCGSLCSSKQVVYGQSQVASDLALYQSTSNKTPEPTHLVANFTQHQSRVQLPSQAAYLKGDMGKFCFMWSAPAQLLVHCCWGRSLQSASLRIKPMAIANRPIAIKTQ